MWCFDKIFLKNVAHIPRNLQYLLLRHNDEDNSKIEGISHGKFTKWSFSWGFTRGEVKQGGFTAEIFCTLKII